MNTPVSDIKVDCELCGTAGARHLNPKEAATYERVTDVWLTTGELAAYFPRIMRSAFIYRLAKLEQLGLVESRRARAAADIAARRGYGNEKEWRRRPDAEADAEDDTRTCARLLAAAQRQVAAAVTGDAGALALFVRDLLGREPGPTLAILAVMREAVREYSIGKMSEMGRLRDVAADLLRSIDSYPAAG